MAYRDRYNLEPLRVRAWLRCGVVSDKFLPLDGPLLYQSHRYDAGGGPDVTIPGDYTTNSISTLPFGITHPGRKDWYYQCSWAQWSHEIEGQDHWNKRFDTAFADLVNFGSKRGKLIIEQGQYKAYHMPVFYRVAQWVEWYCLGDKAEIELFLSTLTHIGKKCVQGWGRVFRWEVEPVADDWHLWRDGQLMRGVPAEDVAGVDRPFNIGVYGIRPSYWKQSNQMALVMP
jgi:CRISPR type IV-associated protein Csf3